MAVVYEVTVSKAKDDAKAAATAAEKAQLRDAFVEVKEALRETVRARGAQHCSCCLAVWLVRVC